MVYGRVRAPHQRERRSKRRGGAGAGGVRWQREAGEIAGNPYTPGHRPWGLQAGDLPPWQRTACHGGNAISVATLEYAGQVLPIIIHAGLLIRMHSPRIKGKGMLAHGRYDSPSIAPGFTDYGWYRLPRYDEAHSFSTTA